MTNDILRKIYDGQVTVKAGQEVEQILSARVSTVDRDRDGEVILPEGIDFTRYRANPILCWQHKLDIPAVGKCVSINADSRGLNCRFQFAPTPFGKELFSLYGGGYLRAFSISFAPLDFDRPTATHRSIELYEISAVNLPSNPQALVQAIGKGLSVSPGLRKELGLKDEIFIEASPEITIEDGPSQEVLAAEVRELRRKVNEIAFARLTPDEIKSLPAAFRERLKSFRQPEISIEEAEKSIEEFIDEYVRSGEYKKAVDEAVEVALAKVRGRVI